MEEFWAAEEEENNTFKVVATRCGKGVSERSIEHPKEEEYAPLKGLRLEKA